MDRRTSTPKREVPTVSCGRPLAALSWRLVRSGPSQDSFREGPGAPSWGANVGAQFAPVLPPRIIFLRAHGDRGAQVDNASTFGMRRAKPVYAT